MNFGRDTETPVITICNTTAGFLDKYGGDKGNPGRVPEKIDFESSKYYKQDSFRKEQQIEFFSAKPEVRGALKIPL